MKNARRFFTVLLALFSVSCSAADPVPGLIVSLGIPTQVSAEDPETATALSKQGRTSVVLTFSPSLRIDEPLDLLLDITADGPFSVSLRETAAAKLPLAAYSVDIRSSCVLRVPAHGTVAALELTLGGAGNLSLRGISLGSTLTGLRRTTEPSATMTVSADCSIRYDSNNLITQVSLPRPAGLSGARGPSAVAQCVNGGAVTFASGSTVWEISTLPHLRATVPLAVFSPQAAPVLQLSAAGGFAQAYLDFGNGAPPADLQALLSCPAPEGDFSLWSWDLLPETLVFDFKDYAVQDLFLKRLAFFAEKPGFVGRLAKDSEIKALHGWNAHDYPASTLFAFYSLAKETDFPLNEQELALYALLVKHSILLEGEGGVLSAGHGAMISICRESDKNLRRVFIDHESSHALFFYDEAYRKLSSELWDSLSTEARTFWKIHFEYRRYDPSNRYLMVNELQAYLVQQSTGRVDSYYRDNVIPRLAGVYPARAEWLTGNTDLICVNALALAKKLDDYLARTWGLRAGAFGRAVRIK